MSKHTFGADPVAPLSDIVVANGLAYTSGQIGFNDKMELVDGGIEEQTHATFKNLEKVLGEAGLNLKDIVRCGCYLVNREDLAAFNKIYSEYFTGDKPARSTIFISGLPVSGSIVEIDCVAATK